MKQILLIILGCLLITGYAVADDLMCDPQEGVTHYDIQVDGSNWQMAVPAQGDGSLKINVDVWGDGIQHTFVARARDGSDWPSEWSNPFDARKPGKPGGFAVQQ